MDKAHYLYGVRQTERVMLIEDEISSGKGVSGFCQALRKNGIEVVSIVSFIETINFEGRKLIKDTTGLDLISLTKIQLIG
jgi:orotate phosphoribosyltransferase